MSCFDNVFNLKRPELVDYIKMRNSSIKLTKLNKSQLLCLIMKLKNMKQPDSYKLNEKDLKCFNNYGEAKVADLKTEIKKYVPSMKVTGLKRPELLCILFDLFTKKKMIPEKEYTVEPTKEKGKFNREEWRAQQRKDYEEEMKELDRQIAKREKEDRAMMKHFEALENKYKPFLPKPEPKLEPIIELTKPQEKELEKLVKIYEEQKEEQKEEPKKEQVDKLKCYKFYRELKRLEDIYKPLESKYERLYFDLGYNADTETISKELENRMKKAKTWSKLLSPFDNVKLFLLEVVLNEDENVKGEYIKYLKAKQQAERDIKQDLIYRQCKRSNYNPDEDFSINTVRFREKEAEKQMEKEKQRKTRMF